MMDNDNTIPGREKQYRSPKTKVVFVAGQDILSVSNPDAYTTEMEEGNDNW